MDQRELEENAERLSEKMLLQEVELIRRRANYFRKSGIGVLILVCGLLTFGGYVFFAANEITVSEISFAKEAQLKVRELEIDSYQNLIKQQKSQSDILKDALRDSTEQLELLRKEILLLEREKELKRSE